MSVMRKTLIAAVLTVTLLSGYGNENGTNISEMNAQAAEAYKNKNYDEALNIYSRMINNDRVSADVYYNIGNCYYRNGDVAKAILNYERALKIDPSMEDAAENLLIANSKKQDKIDDVGEFVITRWMKKVVNIASSDTWANIAMVMLIVLIGCVMTYIFVESAIANKISFYAGGVATLLLIITIVFSFTQMSNQKDETSAIVMSPSVTIKSTPDESGTNITVVHEGVKVTVMSELSEWVEVKLPNGSVGWSEKCDIEKI